MQRGQVEICRVYRYREEERKPNARNRHIRDVLHIHMHGWIYVNVSITHAASAKISPVDAIA